MTTPAPNEVTQLLLHWRAGDRTALDQLMAVLYDELRRVAAVYLRRERPNHTLQATALVNEAYLRLVDESRVSWETRAHFFATAARLMRHILVDHARSHRAHKRGGGDYKVSLTAAEAVAQEPELDLVALDDALKELAALDPQQSQLVELRYFGGLSIEETATVLGISPATVKRRWESARLWLYQELKKQ